MAVIDRFCFTHEEIGTIQQLLKHLGVQYGSITNEKYLSQLNAWSAELPRRLRIFADEFRLGECAPGCVLSRIPVVDPSLGKSPVGENLRTNKSHQELELEFLSSLLGAQFGDLFCWSAQHEGTLLHDLAPMPQHEDMQFGTGSHAELAWHSEDAFHECRCDFIGLFCMRNPQGVGTTVGVLDSSALTSEERRLLMSPSFTIHPDPSYLIAGAGFVPAAERISVLYGNPERPYIRLDPTYMDRPEDPAVARALDHAIEIIGRSLQPVVLQPGEMLVLDNHRAVHGRTAFHAKYDGGDRWVKRLSVARDIRKSSYLRSSPMDRVLNFKNATKAAVQAAAKTLYAHNKSKEDAMRLYMCPGTCATACHIALEESGLSYTTELVDLDTGNCASGDFKRVNRKGYVPALELDNGEILTEVAVILQYIADKASGKDLVPKAGTLERYRTQEWLNYISTEVQKVFGPLWNGAATEDAKKAALEELEKKFDFLSSHLNGKKFLMGDQYTVADAYLFSILNWTPTFKINVLKWPSLMSYMEKVEQRPAIGKVLRAEA